MKHVAMTPLRLVLLMELLKSETAVRRDRLDDVLYPSSRFGPPQDIRRAVSHLIRSTSSAIAPLGARIERVSGVGRSVTGLYKLTGNRVAVSDLITLHMGARP